MFRSSNRREEDLECARNQQYFESTKSFDLQWQGIPLQKLHQTTPSVCQSLVLLFRVRQFPKSLDRL